MRPPGIRQTLGVAVFALAAAALVVALVPVRSDVQDCGTPGAFLLAGRLNAPPEDEDVMACSELAGRRMAAAAGLLLTAGASAVGWAVVADRQERRAWEAWSRHHGLGAPPG